MAQATCAGCEKPIRRGVDFVLAGTEAYHRACMGLVSEGVRARLERDLRTVMAENDRLARRSHRLDEIDRRIADAERESAANRNALLADLQTAADNNRRLGQMATSMRQRAEAAEAELARETTRMTAEIESLRAALARAGVTTGSAESGTTADLDGTVARFRLLELD